MCETIRNEFDNIKSDYKTIGPFSRLIGKQNIVPKQRYKDQNLTSGRCDTNCLCKVDIEKSLEKANIKYKKNSNMLYVISITIGLVLFFLIIF